MRGRLCILKRRLFHKATPGQPPAYAQPQPRREPGNPDAPKNPLDIQTGIDADNPRNVRFCDGMGDRGRCGMMVREPEAVTPPCGFLPRRLCSVVTAAHAVPNRCADPLTCGLILIVGRHMSQTFSAGG